MPHTRAFLPDDTLAMLVTHVQSACYIWCFLVLRFLEALFAKGTLSGRNSTQNINACFKGISHADTQCSSTVHMPATTMLALSLFGGELCLLGLRDTLTTHEKLGLVVRPPPGVDLLTNAIVVGDHMIRRQLYSSYCPSSSPVLRRYCLGFVFI